MAKDQTISNEEYARRVEWLRRYQDAARRQQLFEEALAERRAAAERVSVVLGGTPGSTFPRTDRIERATERIMAAEDALAVQIDQAEAVRAEVEAVIQSEPDGKLCEILYRRYLLGQSFQVIIEAMRYDERHIFRLHHRAVCGLTMPADWTQAIRGAAGPARPEP